MSGAGDKGRASSISEMDVERIYQGLPKVHPGARLDTRILQASRAGHASGRSYPWRWQRPLAMAATVILCVGLVSFYYLEPGVIPSAALSPPEPAAKVIPGRQSPPNNAPSRPAEQGVSTEMEDTLASPVIREQSGRQARGQGRWEARQGLPLKKRTGIPEATSAAAGPSSTPRRKGLSIAAGAALQQAPIAEEGSVPADVTGKTSVQGLSRDALKPARISPTSARTIPVEAAEAMLLQIRKLHDSGQHEAAIRLWREFRQRYPSYPRARIAAILGQDFGLSHWGTTR